MCQKLTSDRPAAAGELTSFHFLDERRLPATIDDGFLAQYVRICQEKFCVGDAYYRSSVIGHPEPVALTFDEDDLIAMTTLYLGTGVINVTVKVRGFDGPAVEHIRFGRAGPIVIDHISRWAFDWPIIPSALTPSGNYRAE